MKKNIIWVAVWALFPLNQATSMDNLAEEQTPRLKRDGSSIVVLPMHDETRQEGFKRARSNTTVGLDEVESAELQLKFKGYYPALSNSDDIFSHVTLSKFFMHFNPTKDTEKTAHALVERGVRTDSDLEIIKEKYIDYLSVLIQTEDQDPANYIPEITRMAYWFEEIYPNLIEPFVRIAEDNDCSNQNDYSDENASSIASED